jgi:glycosyltransferase involved in cell wall biosynthesis
MRIGIDCRKIADFGIGTYIRGLLHALADLGGEEYVAFGPDGIASMLPRGVEHVVVDAPKYSLRELFAIGRSTPLDLFHAPHYVVPLVRVPFVVTIHDLIHLHHRNALARLYARTMISRAVRKGRRVITVSNAVRDDIVQTFGEGEKIEVTPNGVDPIFTPTGRGAILSEAKDLIRGDPSPSARLRMTEGRYFLFVGNDKPHKNVARLVEAFASVPGPQLVLVGGAFERFRNRDRVVLAGFVSSDQLAALYRGAIALLIPSLEEGFGLPALEAMACGTPVITSNSLALVEITGDAALHVDARSVAAIADAMTRVMRDETLRGSMIARGVERAAAFTWRRCAELTREIYRSIA